MLNENARKWVAALRSGEYNQCQMRLHIEGDGYCCLGVACEVFIKEGGKLTKFIQEDPNHLRTGNIASYDGSYGVLPKSVTKWLGLAHPDGQYIDKMSKISGLTDLNDCGATFKEIADLIESEPKGLFGQCSV